MGRLALAAAAAAAALVGWSGLVEPRRLVQRRGELFPEGWPAELDGLRVAVLGDLHAGGPHKRVRDVRRIAERVAAARPDLVLLVGDYVDFTLIGAREVDFGELAEAMTPLASARLGAIGVLGNHDWAHGARRLARTLEAAGIRILENEAVRVGETPLWIAGLACNRFRDPDVAGTFAAVPGGAPVIAAFHDPELWPRIPARAALSVAGHTHGGQVGVPGLKLLFVPTRPRTRYLGGPVREGRRVLWVTAGAGEAGFPFRLLTPPEWVLLTLRSR